MTPERRTGAVRRDMNDWFRGPDGRFAESKVFAAGFKGAALYVFIHHAESVLKDWLMLMTFFVGFIAPELLKKMMSMKIGGATTEGADRARDEVHPK